MRRVHVHLVNENIGGHATLHQALRATFPAAAPDDRFSFFDLPAPRLGRRAFSASVPVLGDRWDADLQPLRIQLAASALVRRHLRDEALPDVLHVYTHNVALLSADLLRRQPTVVSLDATNTQNAYRLPQRRPSAVTPIALKPVAALERRVYAAATLVVSHSAWAASSLRDDYGVDSARIRIIPFGIVVPPAVERPPTGDLPLITFIGRSLERKGGRRLLDVWRRHLRGRARLALVTHDPVAPEEGLEVHGDIRPGDGQAERLLARSDLFVFPTELDTFGYAAIEAMAASLPVVATRTAALPEVVADGETGLLVEVGDDGALRVAIDSLLADPARRVAMGAAGRRRVLERFDARVTTPALVAVLREAADLGPGGGA